MKQTTLKLPALDAADLNVTSEGTTYRVAIAILETQRRGEPDQIFLDLRSIDGTSMGPDKIILMRIPAKLFAVILREAQRVA